jgi:hypothetical protein
MEHAFNVNVAKEFSVNVAIFLQHLRFWTFNNLVNKRNIYDGFCWTYNTLDAFKKTFPYWSKQNLETVIKNCLEAGLIIKGNYNQSKYDRTCWYALTYKSYGFFDELLDESFCEPLLKSISGNQEMGVLEFRNLFRRTKTPIPDTKPDTKPNIIGTPSEMPVDNFSEEAIKSEKAEGTKKQSGEFTIEQMLADNPFNIERELIEDWIKTRRKKRAAITKTAWKYINTALQDCLDNDIEPSIAFEMMVASGWQSLKVEYMLANKAGSKNLGGTTKKENEKIRQRELEAQQRKREEIAQSKQAHKIISEASIKARKELLKTVGSPKKVF